MVLFMVATFCGLALGPVVSGFLQETKTWRWMFYTFLWLGGFSEVFLLTIPETLPAAILSRKARQSLETGESGNDGATAVLDSGTDRTLASVFKVALTRPWWILFDPISFCVAVYYGVVYTLLYMLFSIYPIVFQQKRGWSAGVGELPLLGTDAGACLGGLILFFVSTRERNAVKEGHTRTPEDRLPPAMAAGVLFAVTIFWFAWTAEYNSVPWIVPTLAGTFLATSILLIFAAFINYIVDTYLMYAASAVAANIITRSACAAASPPFTQYMFDALGVGGAGSLIGGVAVLLAPIPFVFYKYMHAIRKRSRFAPTEERRTRCWDSVLLMSLGLALQQRPTPLLTHASTWVGS
jgi:MFS transporter, DHA1 family, multidrug resistance protein